MKTRYKKNISEEEKLKLALTNLFLYQFKGMKLPKIYTLEVINKQFLVAFPEHYYFKYIEILSCSKKISKELDACFIDSAYKEANELKNKLYKALNENYDYLNNNDVIFNCVNQVISNIPKHNYIGKYISLIDCFTSKMNEVKALLCKLLVLFPSNYEELCSVINISLNKQSFLKILLTFIPCRNLRKFQLLQMICLIYL